MNCHHWSSYLFFRLELKKTHKNKKFGILTEFDVCLIWKKNKINFSFYTGMTVTVIYRKLNDDCVSNAETLVKILN